MTRARGAAAAAPRACAVLVTVLALAAGALPVRAAAPAATARTAPAPVAAPDPAPPVPRATDAPAPAVAPEHAAAIRELIAVTGSLDREIARVDEVVAAMRGTAPDLPEAVWTNYAARLRDREALLALYVPAYARHLDAADARAWLAFHRTPVGQRVLAAQEPIREASRAAAQRLATEVFASLEDDAPPATSGATPAPAGSTGVAAVAPSHAAAIRELLEITGALGSARTTMRKLLDAVRASPFARGTPPEAWARAAERLTEPESLYAMWVPAYAAHLSEADVRELVAFHRTPAGARIAAAQPAIHADIVDVAQQYGATSARRAVREVLGPLPQWRPPAREGGAR